MTLRLRMFIAAIVALVTFAAPSTASAARVYYLVGVRHVYRIGTDKYFHAQERKQIEEDYADQVSADNAHYQYQISHGANVASESAQLSSALHDLAVEREDRLAALYERCDWVRANHPSFNLKVDGPYQVIGVNYHERESVEVWDSYVCYAPWPGYVYEGPYPYGWSYGVVYSPALFVSAYNGWYGGWVGFGCPAFVGFYGFGGPIVCAGLSINIGIGFGVGGYYYNPGLGGFYHRGPGYFAHDPFRGGYIASRRDPRAFAAGRAGYAAGAAAIRSARAAGYANGIRAGARSTFAAGAAHGAMTAGRPGYSHSAFGGGARPGSFSRSAGVARAGAVYSHSAVGARTGNIARGTASSRPGGSFARSRPSTGRSAVGYTHSRSTSGGGSFTHSTGRSSTSFGRSFGGATHTSSSGRSLVPARSGGGSSRRRGG